MKPKKKRRKVPCGWAEKNFFVKANLLIMSALNNIRQIEIISLVH